MHLQFDVAPFGDAGQLGRCLDAIERSSSSAEIVATVRAWARRLAGADGIAVVLRDGDQCHYVEEDAIGPLWKGERFPSSNCVSGWAMDHRETVVIPDILLDPRVPQDAYRSTFVRSMAMVPIGAPDARESVGAIGAYWATVRGATPSDVQTLERIAEAAGVALARIEPAKWIAEGAQRNTTSPPLNFDRLRTIIPTHRLGLWQGQLLAVGVVAMLALLRLLLSPYLGGSLLFTVFIPAIFVTALLGGARSAATTVILSSIAAAGIDWLVNGAPDGVRLASWLVFAMIASVAAVISIIARQAIDVQVIKNESLEQRDKQLASILREIDHRSRNTLSVASALTQMAARTAATPAEMAASLVGQFNTLNNAQGLLLENAADKIPLQQLVEQCLRPFEAAKAINVEIDPALFAPTQSEAMLALALHELATNSLKYGALSRESGAVDLRSQHCGGEATLLWIESGGPLVQTPARRSTGTRLIEMALKATPGGRAELSFLPAGLICRFDWHVEALAALEEGDYRQASK